MFIRGIHEYKRSCVPGIHEYKRSFESTEICVSAHYLLKQNLHGMEERT